MMVMLRSFLVIVWFGVLLLDDDVLAMQTNETPSSVKSAQLSRVKGLIGLSSATVGLIVGKKILSGPTFDEIVSLNGKNVVITGANTGLGKETAMKLASFNANLYLLCKDQNKGIEAASDIMKQTGNRNVNVVQVDLSSLRSIESCATQLHSYVDRIDVLINNAGVMAIPTRQVTKDGFESHLGINHLGHYALTGLLMDLLSNTNKPSSPSSSSIDNDQSYSRIVNVASLAHTIGNYSY
jgi:NAD(P)-dependent dehydrogenase (short-subunit alcohol dehydrogenase family)